MWKTMLNQTSKLTLELREIVDNVENPINIWDFEYPSYYQGEAKAAFERKVIDHYYFRQIGFETVGRFKHHLKTKMREIMPYYLQLYKSQEIMDAIDDPFGNIDITETFKETRSGTTTGITTGTNTDSNSSTSSQTTNDSRESEIDITNNSNKTNKFSDTPQGSISNLDNHLTNATIDTENGTNNTKDNSSGESFASETNTGSSEAHSEYQQNNTNSGVTEHTYTKKGNQGVNTYAHDMVEFRQTFLNIDMQIIEELNCLFLQVY